MSIPLSVFDPVLLPAETDPREAIDDARTLAAAADALGYRRLWHGEHHLNPGVLGSNPALTLALVGPVTQHIRLGSAASLVGPRTPLVLAEDFGLLAAAFPGRIDLGLGRAAAPGGPPPGARAETTTGDGGPAPDPQHEPAGAGASSGQDPAAGPSEVDGVVIPAAPDLSAALGSPLRAASRALLPTPSTPTLDYGAQVDLLLGLLDGTAQHDGAALGQVVARPAADVEPWVLGSGPGVSAEVAARRGLRFGANYHVSPAGTVAAVRRYRELFRPSPEVPRPVVSVSAEVLIADTSAEAHRRARGYAAWVLSIRSGAGAVPYPSPAHPEPSRTPQEEALVADRLQTRFVGTAEQVAERLDALARLTGADELLISVSAHRVEHRVETLTRLAEIWRTA